MELVIIGAILLLIVGPSQLPKLGRSLGETKKAFRDLHTEMEKD
jgi:TatA/E family protein of Tat protein translocase